MARFGRTGEKATTALITMGSIKVSQLDDSSIRILKDILTTTRATGIGVSYSHYRAQHDDQLDLLDKLERTGCLRRDQGKYWVSLYGLTLLDDENSQTLMENFEKIYSILRSHYKSHLGDKLMVADLARLANLNYRETAECLGYMIQFYWMGSYSTSFENPAEAQISASETILRYRNFKEIVAEFIRQQTEREAQSAQYPSGFFPSAPPQETHKEVDQVPSLAFIHPNGRWVVKELEKLMAEWEAWSQEVDQIVDQPYDRTTQSEVFADGEPMMQKHEILQSKTLVFLNKHIRGHGFITGFDGRRIDRTDLRLKHRVKHRIQNLRVLRACLDAIQGDEKIADTRVTPSEAGKDIFQLKPTFFGIGIDLKALWQRLRKRFR